MSSANCAPSSNRLIWNRRPLASATSSIRAGSIPRWPPNTPAPSWDCVREQLDDDPGPIGYLPGSDAKHLMDLARGDMIIFGPGSYEVAHAADEHVKLADFEATTAILLNFLRRTLYQD